MSRVSVIIPTYNRADLLRITLDSVMTQTYSDVEVIVVDNASTDLTPEVVRTYGARVRYIRKPVNLGMVDSYNRGWQAATGDYLSFLDSDDTILPKKLELQARLLDECPEVDIVFTRNYYMDVKGNRMTKSPFVTEPSSLKRMLHGSYVWFGSVMARRVTLDRMGPFDENLTMVPDWDMQLRLLTAGCRFHVIHELLCNYRLHNNNSTKNVANEEKALMYTLDKTFRHPGLPADAIAVKGAAYSSVHMWLTLGYARAEDWRNALRHLYAAWRRNSDWRRHPGAFVERLRDTALTEWIPDPVHAMTGLLTRLPDEMSFIDQQRDSLIAYMHIGAALRGYAFDDVAEAQTSLVQAISLNPSLIHSPEAFIHRLAHDAMHQAVMRPTDFVNHVLSNLPDTAKSLSRVKRRVLAIVNTSTAFQCYAAGNFRQTREAALAAVTHHPSFLRNRGLWSIFARSLLTHAH